MKSLRRNHLLFLVVAVTSSAVWAGETGGGSDGDPIFRSHEYDVSLFGETANGNVDSQPMKNTTTTTTTTTVTTTVAAPTAPVPTPTPTPAPTATPTPPQNESAHKAKKTKLKFAAAANARTLDPKVTTTHKSKRVVTHDRLEHNAGGGGITFNYFFTRYIGVGLEGDFLGGNPYDTALTGQLIFRYPFEFGAKAAPAGYSKDGKDIRDAKDGKTTMSGPTWGLAPYVLIGGGGQWDGRAEGIGEFGGGVELRFKGHYGCFVESRWIMHDARQTYAAETIGFSYIFY